VRPRPPPIRTYSHHMPTLESCRNHPFACHVDAKAVGACVAIRFAGVVTAVRESERGRADTAQHRVAELPPLDATGKLWQGLSRLRDETERFAQDERQAIVAGIGTLSGND
jgi:hypothetical protein